MRIQRLDENSSTQVKKAIFGDYTGKIKTFCTMTPENPQGEYVGAETNNKLLAKFKDYLKSANIKYTKIGGKFGSEEHSFMLYNISLSDAINLSTMFNQQSFIFGKSSVEDGVDVSYYEWDGNTYKVIDTVKNVTNASHFDDFYSRHGNFKYQFPFNFDESWDDVNMEYLDRCCDESLTPKSRTNYRAKFYREGRIY